MSKFNRDCCDAVAGNTRAGKFLHQLLFWLNSPKAPVFGGHRWVAFTHERWSTKTGFTVNQIRRILTALGHKKKYIVREQHRYGNKVPNFIRVSAECIEALCAAQVAQKCGAQAAQKCAALYKTKDINEGKKKIATGFAVATPEAGLPGKASGGDKSCILPASGYPEETGEAANVIPFPGQGGPDMTISTSKEVAAGFAAAKLKPIDTLKPDKVATLVGVFREHFKKIGHVAPAVTNKARGQFKHLIKVLPDGKALEIFAHALANWFDVTYAAEKQGAFKSPEYPELGYLVKFQHVAVDVWQKAQAKAKVAVQQHQPAPDPVQTIAQKSKPVVNGYDPDAKSATLAELLALEAEEELKVAS